MVSKLVYLSLPTSEVYAPPWIKTRLGQTVILWALESLPWVCECKIIHCWIIIIIIVGIELKVKIRANKGGKIK